MQILWDSLNTENPSRRDKETLYQIAASADDLSTRHKALDTIEQLPDKDAKMVTAEVAGISSDDNDDAEIRDRAFEMLMAFNK